MSSLITIALIGTLYCRRLSSTLYCSTPGPPIATPTPSAISPVFSPSSLRAASIIIMDAILPLFSSISCFIASPGFATFPPGPSV